MLLLKLESPKENDMLGCSLAFLWPQGRLYWRRQPNMSYGDFNSAKYVDNE